jgi:hypothetical protein
MENTEWGTSLEKALTAFVDENKTTPWPAGDIKKIKEVVQELGLESARFAFNSTHVFDIDEEHQWMRDQGILHVHPTMLVAQKSFSNSIDRGPKPYPLHTHFFALSNFLNKSSGVAKGEAVNQVYCPNYFIHVAADNECLCGEIHTK